MCGATCPTLRIVHLTAMVVPLHTKEDWLPLLTGLPSFHPGASPLVILAPHPDDESLAAGGLIAHQRERGYAVRLLAVTDGENAYANNSGLRERRIAEQTRAAERLGIPAADIVRLHLPDSGVHECEDVLRERLLPHLSCETHLLAPWPGDFHPDHEACGRVASQAASRSGCRLTFYFFWTWHRGSPELLRPLPLHAFDLNAEQQAAKAESIGAHVSQLSDPAGDPILHPVHLWPAELPFEVYLPG